MPELKNVFHAGKMNKDLDERLIPNGQYRDALNVDISFSESSDAGSAQNAYGNVVKSSVNISGAKCIGYVVDKENETIIWFICGNSVDAIVEYNPFTGEVTPILVDANKTNSNAFLNFSNDFLITGANVIDELLFFTDNNSEPKKVNISRMKNGSTNFSTTTKFQNSDGTYVNDVYEELITVIKKYPLNAPKVKLESSIREGNVKGISYSPARTSYVESLSISEADLNSQNILTSNVHASTSGGASILNITDLNYLQRVCNNYTDDSGNVIISFDTTNFTTGSDYKKWRAIEPGMKVAISEGGASWSEPKRVHTVKTVDWLNHTITVDSVTLVTNPTNGTLVRIGHWSEPYNNDYFWAYTDASGNIIKKPIGTSSNVKTDLDGNILKDGGVLGDGTGFDISLTGSDATSGSGQLQYNTGWSYNAGTKTYAYDGTGGSQAIYPKITKATDLLAGHTYQMKATIVITTAGTIGFLSKKSNTNATVYSGINGRETKRYDVGTHEINIKWKQNVTNNDGMLCIFANSTTVGSVKINEINCLTKARPVRIQPVNFLGNTSYEVNDIVSLQANDVLAVNPDDDKFVDISLKLTKKIKKLNNKIISASHVEAIGSGVTGNQKIANGNLSDLTTWHTGTSGTADVGTSSAGFFVTGGALTSSNTQAGYIRNVLSESLVADEVYKLTYTVATATTGSSGEKGILHLILATEDKYTGDDLDKGHSNHILLPTTATGTFSVYWKQKSIDRGAFSLTELMFYNDDDWSGAINNVGVQKVSGNTTTTCGVIGTNNNGRQVFEVEILSIDNSILSNLGSLNFTSKRLQPDSIYEKEFARFSYRWKYTDNQYSAISPFTEVCFLPKQEEGYKYDPKDGYNKSMVNDVRKISLSGVNSMPEDVKSIDILYKKSNATNVYIVKTIENKDFEELKLKDLIVITSEEIKSLLPENQMLRPYDNVPRKALSQEVTANRLMYGNYLQQYNYFNTPAEFKVQLNSFDTGGQALKSLKSIRDYQVGVVFLDSYGRQSPVFTNETGIIKLDQSKAKTSNRIQCSLTSPSPDWATHYKYYIKDSSSEYYNLAMDRFYSDVEDQNVWISFPSSEINKINENDYIVIKKEHDTENAVDVPAGATIKYKVLDKQAEPPQHIKFKMEEVGETNSQTTFSAGRVVQSTDTNSEKNANYDKQFSSYPVQGKGNFAISAFDLRDDAEFLDELESYITNRGVWYDLNNRFFEVKSNLNGTVSEKYELTSIYKKTIINKIPSTTVAAGITVLKNICLVSNLTSNGQTVTIGAASEGTSKSGGVGVSATTSLLSVGMRLVDNEKADNITKKGKVLIITKIDGNEVTLSDSLSVTSEEELIFKDAVDVYLFKTKKPFGADISFLGQSPQNTKIELLNIATASYNASTTILPNPQDLKLKVKFYKQTTEGFGEEFKGKFFIKTKRDGTLNEFIYKSQSSINTFKSKDSAPVYYAQSWLLDQGNGDAIIEDTNLSTSSDYIKEILQIPINKNPYTSTDTNGHIIVQNLNNSIRAFGHQDASNTRLVSGTVNGNGLSLNPETHPNKLVDYAATALVNGSATRLKFGGVTRGIQDSSIYGTLKSINGYSMKEIDYSTPFNSGGAANPSVCIDQSVGFRVIDQTGKNIVGAVPYVGDGWQIGKTFCTFKFFGTAGFSPNKGSLGNLYNFYKYLTTPGQTFRFTNDPTNTVYIIRKSETFKVANTRWGEDREMKKDDQGMLYYDPAVGVQIQLDKGIAWSPLEEVDNQSLTSITNLELSTDSYSNNKTFTSAEEKLNKEKVAKSNASVFSACEIDFGEVDISSQTPAVFEVLPKDKADLELFYETPTTGMIIKDGMSVKTSYRTVNGENPLSVDAVVTKHLQSQGNVFQIKPQYVDHIVPAGETITIFKKDLNGNVVYKDDIVLTSSLVKGQGAQLTVAQNFQSVANVVYNIIDTSFITQDINYFNCFSFGNGVESNRLFDDYNAVTIDKGPRVSTILNTDYKEERKKNGLIYSGIYNSKSSFNNLNQFIQGEKITKDLNPDYGSIQKLFTRNTNVIVLCENKTLKVLANKDALFNADGNPQLTATNKVLGQVVPFVGEYGISTNPESFASYGYRCYYTDKKRGAVIRLSGDGITNISEKGMSKFFRENLDNSSSVIGSYDSLKSNYNVTLNGKTLSFTEKVNGWVSFKSFLPENGVSLLNSYFTFKEGEMYMHNENLTRNTFYDASYRYDTSSTSNFEPSTIKLVFNGEPDTVKDFKTISYEGDTGWTANTITTDKESGSVPSFIEKEGKYFNFIKGAKINNDVDLLKTQGLNVQGVGKPSTITLNSNVRSFTHTVTAVDIASNLEPKKWIINNSTDSTATSKVIKFNEKAGSNVTGKTVDFYIHPQKTKGISWKVAAEDFTFSLTEPVAISNFAGTVAATLHADGYIKVTVTYVSNPFPSANTKTTLTITAGSAYQEQI
tara:strand:+ start:20 stop:7336 length:7317 start_codon:yes stop_codon:yes gene_type:complete